MTTIQTQSNNPHSLQPNSQPTPQPSSQPCNPQPPITHPQPTTLQPTSSLQHPTVQPQPSTSKQPNVQSNINNLCPPPLQRIITNQTTNSPFQYMHTFRYSFDKNNSPFDNKDLIANKYDSIMGITPTQFDFIDNNNTCLVTILSPKETLHNPENLKQLDSLGLTLKLNSNQSEKNSLFCINGPLK